MVGLACKCTKCGYEFSAPNFISSSGPGTIRIKMSGNTTRCPKCGSQARILDGTFSANNLDLEIENAPDETRSVYERLNLLKKKADKDPSSVTPEDVIKELGVTDKKLLAFLKKIIVLKGACLFLTLFVGTMQAAQGATLNINELVSQVMIGSGMLTDRQAEELIRLHNGSPAKAEDDHASEDSKSSDEPSVSTQEQSPRPPKTLSKRQTEHRERTAALRSSRSPSQKPKKPTS